MPGPLTDHVAVTCALQLGGDLGSTGVLPDDRVGANGCPVRASHTTVVSRWLVMPTRGQVGRRQPGPGQRLLDDLLGAPPDLRRRRAPPSRRGAGSARARAGAGRPPDRRGRRPCTGCWSCPGRSLPRTPAHCVVWHPGPPARSKTLPGIPREWEADVLLTDGGTAHLRPIRPSDADRLVAFYDRVSPESKYLRFFAPYPKLSDRDVRRFTQVDYVDRVALIVTLGEEMIAVGRYERIDSNEAEVAFLIEDAHQGRGIGQLLLEHLAEAARERGITKFVAEVLPQNRRMAQVFADAGYRLKKGFEDGVVAVEFPILPTNTSVGVMERREHRAETGLGGAPAHPESDRRLRPERPGPGPGERDARRRLRRGDHRGVLGRVRRRGRAECARPGRRGRPPRPCAGLGAHRRARRGGDRRRSQGRSRHRGAHRERRTARGQPDRDQPGSGLRHPRAGSGRPGPGQHRGPAQRHPGPDAAGGRGRPVLPVGGGRGRGAQLRRSRRSRPVVLHQHRRLRRRHRQRRDAVLGGRPGTRVCLLSLDSIGNPRKFSRITRRLTRASRSWCSPPAAPAVPRTQASGEVSGMPPRRPWTRCSARPG